MAVATEPIGVVGRVESPEAVAGRGTVSVKVLECFWPGCREPFHLTE